MSPGTAQSVAVNVTVSETKGSPLRTNVSYTVDAQSLKGHVNSISLVSTLDPANVLVEMVVAPPVIPIVAQGSTQSFSLTGLFDLVASNHAVVRLTLDNAGPISVPLGVLGQSDWAKTVCPGSGGG